MEHQSEAVLTGEWVRVESKGKVLISNSVKRHPIQCNVTQLNESSSPQTYIDLWLLFVYEFKYLFRWLMNGKKFNFEAANIRGFYTSKYEA